MKIPMPWEKGIVADIRRSLFRRALKRRIKKSAKANRETVFATVLAILAVGLIVRGSRSILGKTASAVARRAQKAENMQTPQE